MHHEHQRPDRTNHHREIESRRANRRGPTPDEVEKALHKVATHDVPGMPNVHVMRVLQEVHEAEWDVDTRRLVDFGITTGDPQHGAMRSDDHVSRYVLRLPIVEVNDGTFHGTECPECGGEMALYKYQAHHHIAGSESLFCTTCEEELWSEEWG